MGTLREAGRRLMSRAAGRLFRWMLRMSPAGSADLEGEAVDETELEARNAAWNEAAEKYFRSRRPLAGEDDGKPWLPDASTSRLVARLGWILSELVFGEHLIVLDFGCGPGWLSRLLRRMEFNVIGLDVSASALQAAARAAAERRGGDNPHFERYLLYDGKAFPLPDASVHFIISHDAFHHVPGRQAVLAEMLRVLTPGGKLILSEPGAGHAAEPSTAEDVARYGVLEREVRISDFEDKALRAGFREVFLKPCPIPSTEKWPRRRYGDFFRGVVLPEIYLSLRRSMIANPLFVCDKEGDFREAWHHRAEVAVKDKAFRSRPGAQLEIPLVLRNTGSLAFFSRGEGGGGGHVTVSLRVFGREGEPGAEPFGRLHLERDLAPGESTGLVFKLTAPREPGAYRLIFEPVCERFYWFSEKGSLPVEAVLVVD